MAQEIADSTLLDTWASSGLIVEPDISKIIEGWQLGEQPPHEYMNWLQNTFGSKLNHILKNGVASWNNTTQYLAGSSVQHNGNVWLCKVDNTNSVPTDANANWKRIITVEALDGLLNGYVDTTTNQTIDGVKTFSSNPISSATQSTAANALTRKDYVDGLDSANVKKTGNQTIDGVKTFSSSPIVPTPTIGTQAVNKDYADTKVSKPELISITGSATFNGITQNINLTNIGNITLEIGDVIEVSGTTSNNKLFTVESIVDNNNIVVNYEHRGTYTPAPKGRLINETASNCTIKLYNRAKNAPPRQGQYFLSASRVFTANVNWQNTGNRSRFVAGGFIGVNGSMNVSEDGVNFVYYTYRNTGTYDDGGGMEIPPSWYVKLTAISVNGFIIC